MYMHNSQKKYIKNNNNGKRLNKNYTKMIKIIKNLI